MFYKYLIVFCILSSCSFDRRKEVSYELLYKQDGFEYDEVFSAAFSARFPPGSAIEQLKDFVLRTKGMCSMSEVNILICEVPVRGTICAVRMIQIKATLKNDMIESTTFLSGGFGC